MGTKGEETKKCILQTAATLFWEHSYNLVKVDQIVKKAQINKASFYQYFKSKEQVALDGIDLMQQMSREFLFNSEFNSEENPIKRLEGFINLVYTVQKSMYDNAGKLYGCPFVNMSTEMSNENEVMRDKITDIFLEFEQYHQKIYEEARAKGLASVELDSAFVGRQIVGILNGASVSSKLKKRPEEFLDALITIKVLMGAK
ncbi:MAG: TetR/AcrR family transcriptional regulator [Campylobacteraceae bacterium]|nr:TetR/AcrR family transcriptional regulator [Campylobacteraceae bacterium]